MINSVLFDLDGTLLDTAPDLMHALNIVRQQYDLAPLALTTVRPYVSQGKRGMMKIGFDLTDADPNYEKISNQWLDIYSQHLSNHTQLFPGMDAVLETLETNNIAWGIVTNKPEYLTLPLLKQLNLTDRTKTIVCGDTLSERKPHPAPVLYACQQLGIAPSECWFVGDDERDIIAGKTAGVAATVAALYGYILPGSDPHAWQADIKINQPVDLIGEFKKLDF